MNGEVGEKETTEMGGWEYVWFGQAVASPLTKIGNKKKKMQIVEKVFGKYDKFFNLII